MKSCPQAHHDGIRWNEDKWSASCPSCFSFGERDPNTHGIEDLVGPRSSDKNKLYSLTKHQILKLWFTDNIRTLKTKTGK